MSKQQIIVDRIENGLAVCEIDGVFKDIPLSQIDDGVQEGDMLYVEENSERYTINKKGTEKRHDAISRRFENIKNRNK